ncbi:CAP-associated domain-containing protein [Paenibacillus sp. YYML68]|uniref:CAP-associated domain-containing protein n=1 Tax=Paenibacillus sp. YYML68 TaxID=2909250 RepID=UPI002491486F|nr:CAP-associated domain-containing protein [Paenibacillus sp. YYML68]
MNWTRWTKYSWSALLTAALLTSASPPPQATAAASFKDTSRHWASKAIDWAVTSKIVNGYEDGTFKPDATVSEPEFIAMLLRAYPSSELRVAASGQQWYEPYYELAAKRNWTMLNSTTRTSYNRGHVARLIASTQRGTLDLTGSVQYLLDTGLSNGKTAATVDGYRSADPLSRAEAVQFLMNMRSKVSQLTAAPAPSSTKANEKPAVGDGTAQSRTKAAVSVRGIAIGDAEEHVLALLGQPGRKDVSEYGFLWYVYNHDYANYAQIGISEGKVVALYSQSDNWHTDRGIQDGAAKSTVLKLYSNPLAHILKGNTRFLMNYGDGEYGTYSIDGSYVTFFYDVHRSDVVTGVQVIGAQTETALAAFYPKSSAALITAYERQTLDLANAARAKLGYSPFVWSDEASVTARKHSQDMAARDFFDHTNPSGLDPFERMERDGIQFRAAAENIAAGQTSAIYAHHGWMNSAGHRKNLLSSIERLGVGVAFGGDMHIYYTQKFYTP